MIQACNACGTAFDLDKVPRNPFKRCPNTTCKAPLDADAVEHTHVEAANPSNKNDPQRLDARAQLHNDVASYQGADLTTMVEKLAAGAAASNNGERKILRKGVENSAPVSSGLSFKRG